jgi:dihydroorotate dehydrogenase (NAD+) catalytic subunit
MKNMDLSVRIANLVFKNPVTVASGTFGHTEDYYRSKEVKALGAIIPKTVTLQAREGNAPPRIVETPAGMLNAIGIENPGVDAFLRDKLPAFEKIGVPIIVSVSGNTDEEFRALVEKCSASKGVAAIELNLSCPNLGHKTLVAQDVTATGRVVALAKQSATVPIIAKLTPNVTDITEIAVSAQAAGADAVSMINTLTGMVIDVERRIPKLGHRTGGLSGPAVRPVALAMVYKTAQRVKIPIIAMGGILTADDALQFLIAGATMVAVGTANFVDPSAPVAVLNGIKDYLRRHHMPSINALRGNLK